MSPVSLKTGHFEKFRVETLLYIFYAMPRDSLQWHAAQELYNRNWRFHKVCTCCVARATLLLHTLVYFCLQDTKMWFTNNPEVLKALSAPMESYAAFDVQKWQHQVVPTATMSTLLSGLLSEEEIRKPA